ncbi:MAG TPA: hypothetical protein ENK50_01025 [Sedimenticola sp.]|nr:hypothetical protein [Sedimenticola sp.]
MEFFRELPLSPGEERLQRDLTIATLSRWCTAIDAVLSASGEQGEIYCLWGGFEVHRECIRGGVRFTLPRCPNALAWTITCGDGATTLHCTINRRDHDPAFIDSIGEFLDAWIRGLACRYSTTDPLGPPCG